MGLAIWTDYLSQDIRDMTHYHCDLEHSIDEMEVEMFMNHLLSARHKQAWLKIKTVPIPSSSYR